MLVDTRDDRTSAHRVDLELTPGQSDRFKKQLEFILEIDKLKRILRKTVLLDRSEQENSAEHSWHIAITVFILSEYAKGENTDVCRVIKMLLVHDLVEIDAGDTYCYDEKGRENQYQREQNAADRIFGILPADQAADFRALWDEFERRETTESKLANALDRFQPFLHNYFTEGQTWQQNDIKSSQVKARMQPVNEGAPMLWKYVSTLIEDAVEKGYLQK